jgi:hypothetical protein
MVVYHLYSDVRTAVLHQASSVVLFHELWSMVIEIQNVDSDKTCCLKEKKYNISMYTTNQKLQVSVSVTRQSTTDGGQRQKCRHS